MRSIRQRSKWPQTHPGIVVINAHGVSGLTDYEYQIVQAGGRVIDDNTYYHKYNRYLLKGGKEVMKKVDWYKWAFMSIYPNGRPTTELIIYEYENK